jgi:iron only hydrogenase large subunit-like protein
VGIHGVDAPEPEAIKITLQDCLACSGCVTTAETMLVTSQSRPQIEAVFAGTDEVTPQPWSVVVSVSDQSAASLAAHMGVSMFEAYQVISGFARTILHADYVTDTRWAQLLSLQQTTQEFLRRVNTQSGPLPLIVSSCPGWVCYVEKTHPDLLPNVCTAMSPLAIAGRYIKQYVAASATQVPASAGIDPAAVSAADRQSRTYHISVQPCFDRKLEAARGDFTGDEYGRDTDCVLGTQELLDWMMEVDPSLPWRAALDSSMEPLRPQVEAPSEATTLEGSGGYHQHIFAEVGRAIRGSPAPPEMIQYQVKRNANHRLATIEGITMPETGKPLICGVVYGFQHIQNMTRGIKRRMASTPDYAFVEAMACPDGCLNGGAQIRAEDRTKHHERLKAVQAAFEEFTVQASAQQPPGDDARPFTSVSAYRDWIGAGPESAEAAAALTTTLHDRKAEMALQDTVAASLKW